DGEVFAPGDLMLSLRNINALVVVDPQTLEVKFLSVGRLLRQHDSDFLPGDRISVFDNRNLRPSRGALQSRILEIDAKNGSTEVVLAGEGDARFFTAVMGSHTALANGNRLINASGEGRVIEFTPDGRIAWRFSNRIADGRNGRVFNARVLPEEMDAAFFATRRANCPQ
ncbi:MAG: arylsulfotransferase family protein, partial [Pseudomonadota bacterium]